MDRILFHTSAKEIGLDLSETQLDQFTAFEDALYEHNLVKNLTRIPKDECWIKHFMDSLLVGSVILPLVGQHEIQLADIGTGPGIPAWPLACAFPNWRVTAIDSNGKMLDFLRTMPLPNLFVVQSRIEELEYREKFEIVTGRAVAPLPIQLELSASLIKLGGHCVPMRTPKDNFELASAKKLGLSLTGLERRKLVGDEMERNFPIYRKFQKTVKGFPRMWSEIKRNPLD